MYLFGQFRLDRTERQLLRGGVPVALQPRVFDTLVMLVERPGKLIGKSEMMQVLWHGTFVGDSALTKNISDLRKALAGDDEGAEFIETVPRSGYRFVSPVETLAVAIPAIAAPALTGETSTKEPAVSRPVRARGRLSRILFLTGILACAIAVWLLIPRTAPSASSGIQSLAVLPFGPLSSQQRDEYLELGMADTLISQLNGTGRLVVRPVSSIYRFVAASDPVSVGRKLQVDAVLQGRVQKIDGALRINAQLIRVRDGALVWAGSVDGPFTTLFTLQDSLARQVIAALALRLTPAEQIRFAKRATTDPDAYESYQKGRYFAARRTPEGFEKAIAWYGKAIAQDPRNALAWSGLADAYMLTAWYDLRPVNTARSLAKNAAVRSLALDDSLAEAHVSMALVLESGDWDFRSAEHEFQRALQLNPNYATAHHWYGEFLGLMGRPDEALSHLRRAHQLDPLSSIIGADTARALINARRYDEAIAECRDTLELDPEFRPASGWLATAYTWRGMYRQAELEIDRFEAGRETMYGTLGKAVVYSAEGDGPRAYEALRKIQRMSAQTPLPGWQMATIYLAIKPDKDKAFEWLAKMREEKNPFMLALKVGPEFDPIRADPRFQELLRGMNFTD